MVPLKGTLGFYNRVPLKGTIGFHNRVLLKGTIRCSRVDKGLGSIVYLEGLRF